MTTTTDAPRDPEWFTAISFPDIPGWNLEGQMRHAFHEVTSNRSVVAFVVKKGNGKTDALTHVVNEWKTVQEQVTDPATGRRRGLRLFELATMTTGDYRDAVVYMLGKLKGDHLVQTKVGQRRKSDDDLRDELVISLHNAKVAAIVLDEAERSAKALFDLLRDIHASAERRDPRRDEVGRRSPLGIGMLLLGPPKLKERLQVHNEAGQRWSVVMEHHPLDPKMVPDVYLTWFPGFMPAVQEMGMRAWRNYIGSNVTLQKPVSIRRIMNHARRYVRHIALSYPNVQCREHVPFDKAIFEDTLGEELLGSDD